MWIAGISLQNGTSIRFWGKTDSVDIGHSVILCCDTVTNAKVPDAEGGGVMAFDHL
jgi:hypothetical protein